MSTVYSVRTLQMEQSKLGLGLASSASKTPRKLSKLPPRRHRTRKSPSPADCFWLFCAMRCSEILSWTLRTQNHLLASKLEERRVLLRQDGFENQVSHVKSEGGQRTAWRCCCSWLIVTCSWAAPQSSPFTSYQGLAGKQNHMEGCFSPTKDPPFYCLL